MPSDEIGALLRACEDGDHLAGCECLRMFPRDCSCNMRDITRAAAAVRASLAREPVELISLRDTFAAAALTGCLAYSHVNPGRGNYQENATPDSVAVDCYAYADAMMVARAARGESK